MKVQREGMERKKEEKKESKKSRWVWVGEGKGRTGVKGVRHTNNHALVLFLT